MILLKMLRPTTNFKSTVISLILISVHSTLSSNELVSGTTLPIPTTTQQSTEKICGTVYTSTGKTVTLSEGVTISPEEFNHVRNITLNKSTFFPVQNCAIQICGYMSSGIPKEKGYIGGESDSMKCHQFTEEKSGAKFFDKPFLTSSISCGCKTVNSKCIGTCNNAHTKSWNGLDCAVLYEERSCNTCYLPQIRMSKNENYTTNNSHHITSLIVRPQCKVLHYAPAMKRVYWFKDIFQPLVYEYMPNQHNDISSPYQPEPETFHCVCEDEERPLVIPETEPPVKWDPPVGQRDNVGIRVQSVEAGIGSWNTALGASIAVLFTVTVIGIFILRRKLNWCGNRNENQVLMEMGTVSPENSLPASPDPESNPSEGQHGDENKLEEKLDDVRKMLELLWEVGGASLPNQAHLNIREKPMHKNYMSIAAVTDQFKSVCQAENIVSRHKIIFRKEGSCLGEGQFGKVYKGIVKPLNDWDGLGEVVAVKVVEWLGCTDEHVKSFLREIKMYQDVGAGSSHIVKLMGACVHEDGLFILTQFCEGGSLKDYLTELRPKLYKEAVQQLGDGYSGPVDSNGKLIYQRNQLIEGQLITFGKQIACGMDWLSGKGMIHGDLAVRNVLLTGDYRTAKICDLGMSRKVGIGKEYVVESLRKFPYNSLAPELCKSDEKVYKLTSNVDVWAYGCTLYEIFKLGECVYAHVQLEEPSKVIEVMRLLAFEGYRHPRPDIMEDDLWDKMMECWDEDPEKRPSFTDLRRFFEERGEVK